MFRIVYYHVGKGDCILALFPTGQSMLIDCYKADEVAAGEATDTDSFLDKIGSHILKHREILSANNAILAKAVSEEKQKQKKIPISVLAVTHADRDHIISGDKLKAHFDIEMLVDSGREYGDPSDTQTDYMKYRKEMQTARKYSAITRAAFNAWPESGAEVDFLSPNRDIAPEEDNNNQCLVIRIAYFGKIFLLTGDSPVDDWTNEDNTGIAQLHPTKLPATSLKASHHGSRTFFTPPGLREDGQAEYKKEEFDTSSLEAIAPIMTFITCPDDEEADFPHPIALELYQEHSNPECAARSDGSSYVLLSRDSRHLHHVVDATGELYMRTSHSRMNSSNDGAASSGPYLIGEVSSNYGRLTDDGIWVVTAPPGVTPSISFKVTAKGQWPGAVLFDWWVLNNGQGKDELHREFYTMEAKDRRKQSSWSRNLVYDGVHIMQCHAYAEEDPSVWANWCAIICFEKSLRYANRWLELFPGCIDRHRINRRW